MISKHLPGSIKWKKNHRGRCKSNAPPEETCSIMDASKKSDRGDGWHIDKSKSSNGFYDSGDDSSSSDSSSSSSSSSSDCDR